MAMPDVAPDAPAAEAPSPAENKTPVAMVSPQEREFRAKLKELRDHLTKNAENVGGKFPEEARKMHYGETEHRSIYGEASPQQAKELLDEGVECTRFRCCRTTATGHCTQISVQRRARSASYRAPRASSSPA
jgi:hypothetical protein